MVVEVNTAKSSSNLPLEGVRVLDLSRVLAGPFCTMLLGDLGSEVLKIEEPGVGDDTRAWGPPFKDSLSAYFMAVNRNKKSITIDLRNPRGRELVYRLAEKSDVLVENFRPGIAAKLGIDYSKIREVNPRIIYCSISGYGQYGPYKDRAAYDLIIQGMGGLMGITGERGAAPVRIGVAITDIGAGMYAAMAILAAYIHREKTRSGQYIDISLLDTSVSWMTFMAQIYFVTGEAPSRLGSAHPTVVPYQSFEASDGRYFNLAVANNRLWRAFCEALGLEHLKDDPRFASNPDRVRNRKELVNILQGLFVKKTRDGWLKIFEKCNIPSGPIYTMDEIFSDPHVLSRKMLVETEHPSLGKVKQIGIPFKLSGFECEIRSAPPVLGQDTHEILDRILGMDAAQINSLKAARII